MKLEFHECGALNKIITGDILSHHAFQKAIATASSYSTCQICVIGHTCAALRIITEIVLVAGVDAAIHSICNLVKVNFIS